MWPKIPRLFPVCEVRNQSSPCASWAPMGFIKCFVWFLSNRWPGELIVSWFRLHLSCEYGSANSNSMPDYSSNEATDFSPDHSEMSLARGNFQVPGIAGIAFHPPVQYRPYMLKLLQFCKWLATKLWNISLSNLSLPCFPYFYLNPVGRRPGGANLWFHAQFLLLWPCLRLCRQPIPWLRTSAQNGFKPQW